MGKRVFWPKATFFCAVAAFAASTTSASALPTCLANDRPLDVNDSQVEGWEDTSNNNFRARAHVKGSVIAIFADQTGHKHFSVQIGATTKDAIEVIYNQSFGPLTTLAIGADVEACGDYISDRSAPDKAILHWVHKSDTPSHPAGYVAINGVLYGQN